MNFTKNIGMLLLAIYLILVGLMALIPSIALPSMIMGILLRQWAYCGGRLGPPPAVFLTGIDMLRASIAQSPRTFRWDVSLPSRFAVS